MDYWVYTGSDLQEALIKANIAIALINAKGQEVFNGDVVSEAQTFENPAIHDGIIYYCGFQAPPDIFINGATCDLIIDWNYEWFRQDEI